MTYAFLFAETHTFLLIQRPLIVFIKFEEETYLRIKQIYFLKKALAYFKIVCFFPNSMQPNACRSGTHPRKRSKFSVTPFGWPFFEQIIAAQSWRGESYQHFENS